MNEKREPNAENPEPPKPLLGAHMSIAGGTPKAIERAQSAGCTALQIFVKNASRWQGPRISDEDRVEFQRKRDESKLKSVVAHDSYLINLASPNEELWNRSILAMVDELERCESLGLDFLVAHPGAHLKSGETEGVSRISEAINRIHLEVGDLRVKIALETTAGQGTTLGYRFEQLRDMIAECREPERLVVCLDTCHVFAAGYDIRDAESYHQTFHSFHEVVGFEKLAVVHVNDSKRDFCSRVDRHEHIGEGKIGEKGFRMIMNDDRMAVIPKILETPKGEDDSWDRKNLRKLEAMVEDRP